MIQFEALLAESVPRKSFISAMRRVASSVTVVTTDGPGGRHGATVSAFYSVADPPSALVCLKADSRIARSVSARNGVFCVNVSTYPAGYRRSVRRL